MQSREKLARLIPRSIHLVIAVTLAGATLTITNAVAAAEASVYGKRLIRSYDMPVEALEKFLRFNATSRTSTGFTPPSEDWTGDALKAASSGNPYTIVVKAVGTAEAKGQASIRWHPGWSVNGATRSSVLPQVSSDVRAGQSIELITASAPVSFKEDREVIPVVAFVSSSNFRLDAVRVEVWSGIGKLTPMQMFWSWVPLATGLAFLALFVWWRRR